MWPSDFAKPSPLTLWRCLERGVAEGWILRDGSGKSDEPFRYWLPERQVAWETDPAGLLNQLLSTNGPQAFDLG